MFPVVTFGPTRRSRLPSPSLVIAALRPCEVWPVVTVHEGLSPTSRRLRGWTRPVTLWRRRFATAWTGFPSRPGQGRR